MKKLAASSSLVIPGIYYVCDFVEYRWGNNIKRDLKETM
jgi:hypothetical protein